MTLQDFLKPFKDNERVIPAAIVSTEMFRMADDWTRIEPTWKTPDTPCPLGSEKELWEWVWEGCEWDWNEIIRLSGLPPWIARDTLWLLAERRLIYPDGTVTDPMKAILGHAIKLPVPTSNTPTSPPDDNPN